AQQFERASRLIVSLEFLRNHFQQEMKDSPITIGLWVGMASTPNVIEEAKEKIDIINRECERGENGSPEEKNVFQISSCPWCGSKIINKNTNGEWIYGFQMYDRNRKFRIECLNPKCPYHGGLPVQVVDQMLYLNPPTLLFATVDKFAMLAWQEDGHVFFNSLDETNLPPDLIIQDELHLLNGPLGSITGIFESVVELLSTRENHKPKILASTATTRNTSFQIEKLYGNRKVNIFPPSGLNINDSYFACETKEEKKRRYLGFMPTGKTALDTQLQLLSHLLVSRVEIFKNEDLMEIMDKYWTVVSYYNSLKDVGKIANKIGDEVYSFSRALQIRLFGEDQDLTFNHFGLPNRQKELTSRIESYQIKLVLKEMEEKIFSPDKIKKMEKGYTLIQDVIDLILATNMISVGIDIGRLNLMLVNGQPKNIAEYIQATSRVCRRTKGLVITSLDANRARDKSYFEHFIPFHQAFYKSIEPLSITPFTENTIDKMVTSLMITHVRHKIGKNKNSDAQDFALEDIESLKTFIKARFNENSNEYDVFERRLNKLAKEWEKNINPVNEDEIPYKKYSELMKRPAQKDISEDNDWIVMQSMREIDTNTFIQIKEDYTINSNNRN
ncbi:MAG: helicase, partial [Candidatus Lokiarchaeota archaeon]|nr:helicase [Candidatus Lokiarchaeota archaeon]